MISGVVKGKQKPILIYSVLGYYKTADREEIDIAAISEKAFELYRNRQFEEAIVCYESIRQIRPDDYLAEMFIQRSREYLTGPPPEVWDGAYIQTTK